MPQMLTPESNTKDVQESGSQGLNNGAVAVGVNHKSENPSRVEEDDTFPGGKPFCKRHRRNLAAFRISTTNIRDPILTSRKDTDEEIPILSPEPISPVRQLKVKHSIPQLMKALPRLPDEAGGDAGADQASRDKSPGAEQPSPGQTREKAASNCEAEQPSDPACQPQPLTSPPLRTQTGLQRFRLKVKSSHGSESKTDPEIPERVNSEPKAIPAAAGITKAKKKLKVKINRNPRDCGSILRSPNLKQCNSLAEIGHNSGTELLLSKKGTTGRKLPRRLSDTARAKQSRTSVIDGQSTVKVSSPPSDDLSLPKSLPRTRVVKHQVSRETNQSTASENTSNAGNRPSSSTPHGLRQKLSMLRLRSGEPRRPKLSKRKVTPAPFMLQDRRRSHASRLSSVNTTLTTIGTTRREGRFKRLARNAKRIVRRYVRKRLD